MEGLLQYFYIPPFRHAGASTGVTICDLNNSYWKPSYLGAKTAF
jgi:cell wall-associated NlpC family hydrolase